MTTSGTQWSWLHGHEIEGDLWSAAAQFAPEVFSVFGDLEQEVNRLVPTDIVQLCRARMATLLGAPTPMVPDAPERAAALAQWPTSPMFSELDRACLAVAEQFVMDVTGIDQAQIDSLSAHLRPEETLAFVNALWFEEALLRLALILGTEFPSPIAIGSC